MDAFLLGHSVFWFQDKSHIIKPEVIGMISRHYFWITALKVQMLLKCEYWKTRNICELNIFALWRDPAYPMFEQHEIFINLHDLM